MKKFIVCILLIALCGMLPVSLALGSDAFTIESEEEIEDINGNMNNYSIAMDGVQNIPEIYNTTESDAMSSYVNDVGNVAYSMILIITVIFTGLLLVAAIVLLCFSISIKKRLNSDSNLEKTMKKLMIISIIALVMCVLKGISLSIVLIVLPIIALVYINDAKKLLSTEKIEDARRKLDTVSILLIVMTSIFIIADVVGVLGIVALTLLARGIM